MSWEELVIHLERALFMGGLDVDEAEVQARRIVPHSRHRTFQIGRVDPFKIDFYERSLGLTVHADGSHPEHIEVDESFPPWIPPLLRSNNQIVEALTQFAEQIQAHLHVLGDIGKASENLEETTLELVKAIRELRDEIRNLGSSP